MKFRMLKNGLNQFKVQKKGWFFWKTVKDDPRLNYPRIFNTLQDAETYIERRIAEHKNRTNLNNWQVFELDKTEQGEY